MLRAVSTTTDNKKRKEKKNIEAVYCKQRHEGKTRSITE